MVQLSCCESDREVNRKIYDFMKIFHGVPSRLTAGSSLKLRLILLQM